MDGLFIGLFVFFLTVGIPYLMEKDANEKRRQQEEINMKRRQQEITERWKR